MKQIVVVGSINMDLVVRVGSFLKAGETKEAINVQYFAGGKGANQAVAAAKSGANVTMIGAVGQDSFAQPLINELANYNVNVNHIMKLEGSSGLAIITVNEQGENQIMLNGGANQLFTAENVLDVLDWHNCEVIILQNEISWETTKSVIEAGAKHNIPVWYNPAPARKVTPELMKNIDLIIMNETEAEMITNKSVSTIDEAKWALQHLQQLGVKQALITLGEKGCIFIDEASACHEQAAFTVKVKDTTAAGDTFIGSLAAAMFNNHLSIKEALRYASAASALAVSASGAQQSIPTKQEIEQFLLDK